MRISRDQLFMEWAHSAAKRSTCFRGAGVGAILIRTSTNQVLSAGYNGPPSGEAHCQGNDCPLTEEGGCSRSDHAERNALERAVQLFPEDMTMYGIWTPCFGCAQFIVANKVSRFVYSSLYRDTKPIQLLLDKGVILHRITFGGYLIDHRTNLILNDPQDHVAGQIVETA